MCRNIACWAVHRWWAVEWKKLFSEDSMVLDPLSRFSPASFVSFCFHWSLYYCSLLPVHLLQGSAKTSLETFSFFMQRSAFSAVCFLLSWEDKSYFQSGPCAVSSLYLKGQLLHLYFAPHFSTHCPLFYVLLVSLELPPGHWMWREARKRKDLVSIKKR